MADALVATMVSLVRLGSLFLELEADLVLLEH
jgi:hypothetical protein